MARTVFGSGLHRNTVSYLGGLVVVGCAALIALSFALQLTVFQANPYIGIITYLVLPGILTFGLLVFLWGMRRESLRRRRAGSDAAPPFPAIDLNDPVQRRIASRVAVGGLLVAVILVVAGYHAFLFTESVFFCGRICHTVMEPEYTAYLNSPHARVTCVECHVGSGASWYVKSKLSGVRQVFAVALHSYERPIPVPIEDLRPARETCEHCHWPEKFFGAQLIRNPHFRYDESNTAEQISFLVKTGGGNPRLGTGAGAGIHWHMLLDNRVTFAASDRQLQVIPWISVTKAGGAVVEYVADGTDLTAEQLAALPRRTMDCMDCHNRPTHIYTPPETAVDRAMASGLISRELPWIKKVAVEALVVEYPDSEAAARGIREDIESFYRDRHPAVAAQQPDRIEEAVRTTVLIYGRNVFPKMKVDWRTYASNIGHRNWPGCFRCHDGRHRSKDGATLTAECSICHTEPVRTPLSPLGEVALSSDLPWHPMELAGKHAEILCTRCHAAGYRPPLECSECHTLDAAAPMMESGCETCHLKLGSREPLVECRDCHDGRPGLHARETHAETACTDCHLPHGWKATERAACLTCHDDMEEHHADGGACATCHEFGEAEAGVKAAAR